MALGLLAFAPADFALVDFAAALLFAVPTLLLSLLAALESLAADCAFDAAVPLESAAGSLGLEPLLILSA